ncbi:SUMO deconjugating cysteine peptidase Ulp2 [Ectocarpus siliculosus]|uniref:SUMO deconjugating cysteine peptidase Ulp2 n=1 Tax=Ectocarpus siliculosus TaxID=2880 RepID=D7FWD8_ECTSI|nr:SUMO deconjugating cysteine peptidase Ulp2 [Ectocarpus siliculosus]|eukprot:CBJ32026.1 SUMO deconjugating cysteine peptidase Ulp2 [Ectocarpus siliculosus]
MDTIAHRWKRNSRTIDRTSTSGELDAEALRHPTDFQRTIKSVEECTAEAGHGVTSNAWRKRLESAKSEVKTACLKAISSKGTRPDAILEAANVFVEKISSTYTDEKVDQVKTFRNGAEEEKKAGSTSTRHMTREAFRQRGTGGGGVGTGHDGEDSRDPGGEGASSGSSSQDAGPRGDAERWNGGGGSVAAGADGNQGGDARGLAAAAAPACDTGDAAAAVVGSGGRTKPNCGCMDETKVHIFSSSFFTKLVEKDIDEFNAAYGGVKRWSRHVDLFSMKFVMVPVVEDEHWRLACLCNLNKLEAKWKDTGRGDLVFDPDVLPLVCPQAPTQPNAYARGVYVLRFAKGSSSLCPCMEMYQKWPVVKEAGVNDGMQAHFNPELFSPSDITEERRMLGKLLQDCKVRYKREEEQQSSEKRKASGNTHAGSNSGSEVEVEEPPPTMSSGDLSDAWCCRWNNKNNPSLATQR